MRTPIVCLVLESQKNRWLLLFNSLLRTLQFPFITLFNLHSSLMGLAQSRTHSYGICQIHCILMPPGGIVPTLKELTVESVRPGPLLTTSPLTLICHQDLNTHTTHTHTHTHTHTTKSKASIKENNCLER